MSEKIAADETPMEARPLTPEARRRPDALSGALVKLADGLEWELPKPRVRFAAGGDGYRVVLSLDGADGYQAIVDASENAEDPTASVKAQIALGSALLLRNYDVTPEESGELIQFAYIAEDDPEGFAIKEAVVGLALGVGPKRQGGTNG